MSTHLLPFPLWLVLFGSEDCFVPEWSAIVIEACVAYDSETIAASWELIAMNAREEICGN